MTVVQTDLDATARAPVELVLERLGSGPAGLTAAEAERRLVEYGPNALRSHGVVAWGVFVRQLRNPLLLLLARGRGGVGLRRRGHRRRRSSAVIVTLSVGLGFVNEYRSEQAVEALHRRSVTPRWSYATASRSGSTSSRSFPATSCSCRSATSFPPTSGCSTSPSSSATRPCSPVSRCRSRRHGRGRHGDGSCALMGTIVREGSARGVVVRTGTADRVRSHRGRARRAARRDRVPGRTPAVLVPPRARRRAC